MPEYFVICFVFYNTFLPQTCQTIIIFPNTHWNASSNLSVHPFLFLFFLFRSPSPNCLSFYYTLDWLLPNPSMVLPSWDFPPSLVLKRHFPQSCFFFSLLFLHFSEAYIPILLLQRMEIEEATWESQWFLKTLPSLLFLVPLAFPTFRDTWIHNYEAFLGILPYRMAAQCPPV